MIGGHAAAEDAMCENEWNIELECTNCRHRAVPRFERTANTTVNVVNAGRSPHVFADVNCSDLKTEAGDKLRGLFTKTAIPLRNKLWMSVIALPCIAGILSLARMWVEPLNRLTPVLVPLSIILLASIPTYKYLVQSIRRSCRCGDPRYSFLGLLGTSYCYPCLSCGRLLRLLF